MEQTIRYFTELILYLADNGNAYINIKKDNEMSAKKISKDDEEILDLYDRLASQWARDYEALHPTD